MVSIITNNCSRTILDTVLTLLLADGKRTKIFIGTSVILLGTKKLG